MANGGALGNFAGDLWSTLPLVAGASTASTTSTNASSAASRENGETWAEKEDQAETPNERGPRTTLTVLPQGSTKKEKATNEIHGPIDWTESAQSGVHIWTDVDSSGHSCSIPEEECMKSGPKQKCSACKMVVHKKCIEYLEKLKFTCKITFREGSLRSITDEERQTRHHWVYQRKYHGKCRHCGKSFHNPRALKDIVAVSCSWCKYAYHYNDICAASLKEEYCTLGVNNHLIVPPSWIVKLPIRRFRNSSIKKKYSKRRSSREQKAFAVRPDTGDNRSPLLVFINPKSGGKQGSKIIRKFQWLLNPRQVFNLSQGGPKFGLQLYRKVPNLRILACGGDGTVGWVLSELDTLQLSPLPPVAVLPLGTGNDLSRILNWGGGYTDEPIERILQHLDEAQCVQLDRWNLDVSDNNIGEKENDCVENLPLSVMNNYFSIGADAEVSLEFHESREANPDKFSNRFYSLYFYGKAGGRTVIQRKSKDLFRYVMLECDGVDLTPKIKELRPHCLLFLNIPSYSAGTSPWGNPLKEYEEFRSQSCDDGYLEVIGLTSTSLATTRVGGHGFRISQCQRAVVKTSKSLPVQVDGEPCRLLPSVIRISLRNQATMLRKLKKHRGSSNPGSPLTPVLPILVKIYVIEFQEYQKYFHDIREITQAAVLQTTFSVEGRCDLVYLRNLVETFFTQQGQDSDDSSSDWCFLDASYSDRVYRIDSAQEGLYDVSDILEDGIFIVKLNNDQANERKTENNKITKVTSIEDLIRACSEGNLSKVQNFFESGMSLARTDTYGRSPLHYAVINNRDEIIDYIISKVSVSALNQVDDCGQTALHKAAIFKQPAICTTLVQAGADVSRKDYDGNSAAMIAAEMGEKRMARYLREQEYSRKHDDGQETSV